jgi:pimeloyl-ACP methyl ester carboxylesterase
VRPIGIATYVLIHGAGSDSWYWHRVAPELRARGHDVVAPDLPCDDDSAGLMEYGDVVVDAIGDRTNLVLVAQSLAGFTAPLVCERLPVALLVMLAAMVPDVLSEALARGARRQSATPFQKPWPLSRWPDVPTRFLLCRDDRFFPAEFMRRIVKERLGMTPDEMDGGHLSALSRPKELVDRLEAYRTAHFRGASSA